MECSSPPDAAGIYIDAEAFPLAPDRFLSLLEELGTSGFRALFIAFGGTFPFRLNGSFCSDHYYPETIIDGLAKRAVSLGIEIVPVLPSLLEFSSLLEKPCFSGLRRGLSESGHGDLLPTARSIMEDLAEEIIGVLNSPRWMVLRLGSVPRHWDSFGLPLSDFLAGLGVKPLILCENDLFSCPVPFFRRDPLLGSLAFPDGSPQGDLVLSVEPGAGERLALILPGYPVETSPLGFELALPRLREAGLRLSGIFDGTVKRAAGELEAALLDFLDSLELCRGLVFRLDTAYFEGFARVRPACGLGSLTHQLAEELALLRKKGEALLKLARGAVDPSFFSRWVWARVESLRERADFSVSRLRIFERED